MKQVRHIKGFKLVNDSNSLVVTSPSHSRVRRVILPIIIGTVIGVGRYYFFTVDAASRPRFQWQMDWDGLVICALVFALGIVPAFYGAAVLLLNKIVVKVTSTEITRRYSPLPVPGNSSFSVPLHDVREVIDDGIAVVIVETTGERRTLFAGVYDPESAAELAEAIELAVIEYRTDKVNKRA